MRYATILWQNFHYHISGPAIFKHPIIIHLIQNVIDTFDIIWNYMYIYTKVIIYKFTIHF